MCSQTLSSRHLATRYYGVLLPWTTRVENAQGFSLCASARMSGVLIPLAVTNSTTQILHLGPATPRSTFPSYFTILEYFVFVFYFLLAHSFLCIFVEKNSVFIKKIFVPEKQNTKDPKLKTNCWAVVCCVLASVGGVVWCCVDGWLGGWVSVVV